MSKISLDQTSHDFCATILNIILQYIESGFKHEIFLENINITKEQETELSSYDGHIFEWLAEKNMHAEISSVIYRTTFPALLRDSISCTKESIRCARNGSMTPAFMLIRKPLQESLYIYESMLLSPAAFVNSMSCEHHKLQPHTAGGVEQQTKRVQRVLEMLGVDCILDSEYIAKLRYKKDDYDSLDGICNKAMHLITSHHAIKTEELNLNIIFSDKHAINTQRLFYFSRLPYLLFYFYHVFEGIASIIHPTEPSYLEDMNTRISAGLCAINMLIPEKYKTNQMNVLSENSFNYLSQKSAFQLENSLNQIDDFYRIMVSGS
jgi:hypothetical protein